MVIGFITDSFTINNWINIFVGKTKSLGAAVEDLFGTGTTTFVYHSTINALNASKIILEGQV